jgi:hypothetical protein
MLMCPECTELHPTIRDLALHLVDQHHATRYQALRVAWEVDQHQAVADPELEPDV